MTTKTEFEKAYRKFPPSSFELFYLRYFSIHSLNDNKRIAIIITFSLLLPFLSGIIFQLLHFSKIIQIIPNLIYIFLFISVGTYLFIVWYKKRRRAEMVRKHLEISKEEYKNLINSYYYHRYPNLEKYVKYNSH